MSSPLLAVAGIVIALVVIAILLAVRLRSAKRNAIVVTGPMNAGKTALYYRVMQDGFRETVPSLRPNDLEFDVPGLNASIRMIDYPGHSSFRLGLSAYLDQAVAVVFVVDSASPSELPAAAKLLHAVLVHPVIHKRKVPVLVVCNKADLQEALPVDTIAHSLENEIDVIQQSRESMKDIDARETQQITLGQGGAPFKFSHCPGKVMFGSTTALKGDVSFVVSNIPVL
ncbi:Signal recognition particle receptor subunit beta [Plasmodiophora brassicae]|nr:hypothetical protein PBRA_003617 [Plasmodiophora brassicae]